MYKIKAGIKEQGRAAYREMFDSLSYEEHQELLHLERECCEVGEVGEKTLASDDRELPF